MEGTRVATFYGWATFLQGTEFVSTSWRLGAKLDDDFLGWFDSTCIFSSMSGQNEVVNRHVLLISLSSQYFVYKSDRRPEVVHRHCGRPFYTEEVFITFLRQRILHCDSWAGDSHWRLLSLRWRLTSLMAAATILRGQLRPATTTHTVGVTTPFDDIHQLFDFFSNFNFNLQSIFHVMSVFTTNVKRGSFRNQPTLILMDAFA